MPTPSKSYLQSYSRMVADPEVGVICLTSGPSGW